MQREKAVRIVSALTATAVLLLVTMLGIFAYQLTAMIVKKNQIAQLTEEIEMLKSQIDNTQSEIDTWLEEWKIEEQARKLGYIKENDK